MVHRAYLRRTFSFAFAVSALLGAQAQRSNLSGIGIKAGPLLAGQRSGVMRYGSVPGATVGIHVPYRWRPSWEVQAELLLSAMGARYTDELSETTVTSRLLYVHVPVSVKLFLGDALNMQLGGQIGYLLDAHHGGTGTTELYEPVDHGVIVGLGHDRRGGLDLNLRYYSGLADILRHDEHYYPSNRALQLTVGKRIGRFSNKRLRRW